MKRHVIVNASSLFWLLLFSGGIPMRQQLAARQAWSALFLTLSAMYFAPLHAEDASKPAAKVELSREERIEQALDRPCELAVKNHGLDDVAIALEDHYHFAVRLDSKALMEAGVEYETPMTLAKSSSLAGALKQMLASHELTFVIRHEALMITTAAAAEVEFETRVYPVNDLVCGSPASGLAEAKSYTQLVETITRAIDPNSWLPNGGSGTVTPFPNAGAVVISHNRQAHEEIQRLLSALRDMQRRVARQTDASKAAVPNLTGRYVVRQGYVAPEHHGFDIDRRSAETRRRFEAALQTEGTKYICESSLEDFIKEVSTHCNVPIILHQKSLTEAGIQSDLPTVRIDLKNLSYRSALEIVLGEHDLTWLNDSGAIVVCTKAVAESGNYPKRLYSVAELVVSRELADSCTAASDHELLIEVVEDTIGSSRVWYYVPPEVSIQFVDDTLVVVHPREVQEQIEQVLAMLREVKARQFPEGKLEPMPEKAGDGLVLRVYEVSAKPKVVGGGFFNFDEKQPAATGTPAEKPKADTAKPPETVKCDAPATPTVNPDHVLAEQLVKAIPELIEPKSWQAGGGPGKIFAVGPRLLARQTCDVHAQIKDLLKAVGQ